MKEFTSPKSDFGYDDAYSLGDTEFIEGMNLYKQFFIFVKSPY